MKTTLLFLLAALLLFSACAQTDSTISVVKETEAHPNTEQVEAYLYVNSSTKTIHYFFDCLYLKQANEENVTKMNDTPEHRKTLSEMEYTPCANCRLPDYLT